MKDFRDSIQNISPRYLYIAVIVVITIPLLFPWTLPGIPAQPTQQAFNVVEHIAKTKPNGLVLIASDWSASTHGENHWQDMVALHHLMKRHLRFAVLSLDPQNRSLTQGDIDTVAREMLADHELSAPYVYGRDYCLWGYRPSTALPQLLKGMVSDIPETITADYRGTRLQNLPCMRGVHSLSDVSMIMIITPTAMIDNFLQFVPTAQVPIVYFPTSVMAPEGYPYLDSHQIAGMVAGVKGAGDYEELLGINGFGRKISTALSLVYFLILALILLGNIGYYAQRVRRRDRAH